MYVKHKKLLDRQPKTAMTYLGNPNYNVGNRDNIIIILIL